MHIRKDISAIDNLTHAASSVVEGLSLPDILQRIVDIVREMVGVKYTALGVPSEDGTGLRSFTTSGLDPAVVGHIEHEPVGRGLLGVLLTHDEAIRLERLQDDPRSVGFCGNHPAMTSFLGVPIIGRNHRRLGNLYLCDRLDGQPFDDADEQLVKLFASFAAIAIENAKLHQRLQMAALRSERDRISMDLHDGIIQQIYAIGMKIEIMRGTLNTHEREFQTILSDLNSVIENIRTYIHELHSADKLQASSLRQQIENLSLHFHDFSGIHVDLEIASDLPALTDNQRHSLSQIVREALANVARHANATKVMVQLYIKGEDIHLVVKDNGHGMNPEQLSDAKHFGLRNMQQRARRLKGALTVESEAGQGTAIHVAVPIK